MSLKSQIESIISVPHEDITTAIKLRSFNILLLCFWGIMILMNSLMAIHAAKDPTASYGLTTVFDELFICLLMCVSFILSTRGHLKGAVWTMLVSMIVGTAVGQFARGETYAIILVYPLAIFTAGLILGARSAVICFFMTSVTYIVTIQAIHEWGPYLQYSQSTMDLTNHIVLITSLLVVLLLTWLFTRNTQRYIERLEANNREKEILLREIHHRVKNNLQIVSSLLNLQSESLTDEYSRNVFQNSVGRIKSMALVHEKLYRSNNLSKIVLVDYIRGLLEHLSNSYESTPHIKITSDIDSTELDIEQSLSVGLIVNELVTNSMKHAFKEAPNAKDPWIRVEFRSRGNTNELTVSDNGKGMEKSAGLKGTGSLGMQLVIALVEELEGTMTINSSSGTEIKIKFDNVGG